MPVTHSQESCTRNLYKSSCTINLTVSCFLVQVISCTRILHQIEQSSIRCKELANTWSKLSDVIGRLVCCLCWLLAKEISVHWKCSTKWQFREKRKLNFIFCLYNPEKAHRCTDRIWHIFCQNPDNNCNRIVICMSYSYWDLVTSLLL